MSETRAEERTRAEIEVLNKFGLRWSILAAWRDDLLEQHVDVTHLARKLENVRSELCAGCFSSCGIGCALGEIEGELLAKGAESPGRGADFWIDLLGEAMSDTPDSEEILRHPAVEFHYLNCGFLPCRCADGGE
jgi:hypothetical protein